MGKRQRNNKIKIDQEERDRLIYKIIRKAKGYNKNTIFDKEYYSDMEDYDE
jgi:hypothetical protein